ncbi:MAG: hypothetical protein ACR2PT_06935 [Endozoicomonas sp.]
MPVIAKIACTAGAGVAVSVKRIGSAGDEPAPDILKDWLTVTQVNTERGRNELAKGGKVTQSVELEGHY